MRGNAVVIVAAFLTALAGCDSGAEFLTEERMANGLVIILPGIEGESPLNHSIREGLAIGGVNRALAIHGWGVPVPIAGVLINQTNFLGNRIAGATIARMVTDYQDSFPGRPVHIVGHSGGGGVAVFAAEAMPEGRQVDGLVLLSASISGPYDLTKALNNCRHGILNFYNLEDTGLLGVGTALVGNVDGGHGTSAGLAGFDPPAPDDPAEKKLAYGKLWQRQVTTGDPDPHASTTRVGFVSREVAPWILWPPQTSPAEARAPEAGQKPLPASSPGT